MLQDTDKYVPRPGSNFFVCEYPNKAAYEDGKSCLKKAPWGLPADFIAKLRVDKNRNYHLTHAFFLCQGHYEEVTVGEVSDDFNI